MPTVAGRILFRSVSSAAFETASVPLPSSGIVTRATVWDGLTSTSIGPCICPVAIACDFSSEIACCVAGESVFASIATIAGERSPFENAFSIFFIVPTVGALFGIASNPLCAVWSCRTGAASTSRTPPEIAAATTGRRKTGVRIAFQNRFSPLSRRSRCRNGILPFSTLSPRRDSRAGNTVSEPSIAMPTTIIVAMPKPR